MSAWNDFLEEVRQAENDLGHPREVWYRGHSDESWSLTPSLLRYDDWGNKEKNLFLEFTKTASVLFDKRGTDWETLFDMQHYWVPTRLLDWTSVMGVAIAFILHNDYSDSENSALFVLDPTALNRLSGREEVINIPEDKTFDYKTIYWDNRPIKLEKPIAIRPPHQSDRLRAQKGVFTVHGAIEGSFEELAQDCFRKIILSSDAKEEAKDFLKWANLDEYTIYPDIVGMAQHIKRKIL
ncbi:FRG domain-containing protein [Marinomonas lutimaris]|uniref:FRG domain-containing protein n=1 Tax=Marinomonas lutimaris TaxID=2846746 RepID=UPI001C6735E5|nr:FRG domain-containing protein [Marinomonas lutimaris]